jgi:penicillin-binding protein 2B
MNKFVFIGGFLLFCVIIARIIFLNLSPKVDGINLKEFAKNRNTTKQILYASRGSIYDKNNEVLAETVDSYTVIAYLDSSRSKNSTKPRHVVDKEETAKKLSPLINMTPERIYELLDQDGLYQVELGPGGRGLTELQKESIEKLKLPGIDFIASSKRYYPNLDFASYILGYVVQDEDGNMTGEMGIESKYNDKLNGINGSLTYQQDINGYRLVNIPEVRIEKEDGYDIYLTIDSNVQLMAERALDSNFEASGATSAIFVVAEAKTGKIIASATKPSFDPNIKDIENYLNPLTSISFEPGSTMKTYTYMATMEKGNYNGQDTYLSGTMDIGEYTIKDWNTYGWGTITYDYGYMQSSNIGIANLMQKYLTGDELKAYLKKLGFGSKTGIELNGETEGDLDFKYEVEIATAGFGQGITTTPIQHIKALTAISNDGYVLNPTIVEKIVDPNTKKVVYQAKEQKGTKVASMSTVNKIKDLMDTVVNNYEGTGSDYHLDGYSIIGKTGTAEVYNPNTGTYYESSYKNYKSFAGMYPKDNPKYIFYIAFQDCPSSYPLSNSVKSLIKDLEAYYNLTNVRENKKSTYDVDNYINKKVDDVKNVLDVNQVGYIIIGDGQKIIKQYPESGIINGKVLLLTNGKYSTNDLYGLSSKEVRKYCSMTGFKCNIQGNGYVSLYNYNKDEKGNIINIDIILDQKYEEIKNN